jgi:uncharacterized membrane protein YgaE (UPF0421/DUF939 family)
MSDLTRRPGGRMTRAQRERRAYLLTLATGIGAVATVVTFLLALFTSFSFGVVFLLAILTVLFGFGLRRTLGR